MTGNVTGWNELVNGKVVEAAFVLFDEATAGYLIGILFLVFEIMLFIKTRNLSLCFFSGLLILSLLSTTAIEFLKPSFVYIVVLVLAIELSGILYLMFVKG